MRTKYLAGLMGFILFVTLGILFVGRGDSGTGYTLTVTPSIAALSDQTTLTVMGSGYAPGEKVYIMFDDQLGVPTAIGIVPVADKNGAWVAEWRLADYAGSGIIPEGVIQIRAADADYKVFAVAPVGLVDNTKDPKTWPAWAAAAGIAPGQKKKKKK
ncbi:MAG: hypothetical protein Q8P24_03045 [Desulfobacterales bacterium]|nr:hypothetical protein [Desulfobacterales bacterium]